MKYGLPSQSLTELGIWGFGLALPCPSYQRSLFQGAEVFLHLPSLVQHFCTSKISFVTSDNFCHSVPELR